MLLNSIALHSFYSLLLCSGIKEILQKAFWKLKHQTQIYCFFAFLVDVAAVLLLAVVPPCCSTQF